MGGGRAKELSESVGAVFLKSASAEFFFAQKIYDGGTPSFEFSQGKNFGFDWGIARRRVEQIRKLKTVGPAS